MTLYAVTLYEIAVLVDARCAEIAIFHGPLVAADFILAEALGPADHTIYSRNVQDRPRRETHGQQPTGGPTAGAAGLWARMGD